MSIGNANLHQRGEIPEIVKLPNGRIRIIRRFHKFTREDIDNAALGSTMGNFGDLDTTGEQIANQGYTDCRLISVEVDTRFNSVSNADNAVLVKTYETLTSSFVQITDDTVTFTENGLRQVTRVYRAVSGTTSTNVIGTTNFSSGGTTVYLASSKLDDNDAFAELTEQYVEAGTLSRAEDFVGSQDSLVIEAIGPDPATPSGFSLASKQESNFEGFQTNRFTFLKDDVQLSQSEDEVGSQNAITEQWFKPSASRDTKVGYSLARKEESEVEGIPTERYTFLKPSILSVQQEFNQPRDRITVRAFNKTSTEVDTALSEITVNHRLIAQSEDDFEGIKTSVYTYELNFSDTITIEENGLRTLTRSRILTAGTSYTSTVGTSTITHEIDPDLDPSDELTLYLASFSIQDTEQFRLVTEEYIEAGILSINKDYVSEGVCRVTTTFLVTEGTVIGPIIGRAIGDHDGLKTIAVTHMQQSDGTSLIDDSNPAVSHKMLDNFTYPGTVRLDYEALTGSGTYSFDAVDYALEAPVNAKIPAVMEIHFRTNDTITYPTGYPLWNPTEWAYGESKGIAWNYVPFSISRAFRGYRTTATGAYQSNNWSSTGTNGTSSGAWDMISGRRIFAGTTFHIYVAGGPEDPACKPYTLDYRISEAFQDLSGNKYYKHVIIRTDGNVPTQDGSECP